MVVFPHGHVPCFKKRWRSKGINHKGKASRIYGYMLVLAKQIQSCYREKLIYHPDCLELLRRMQIPGLLFLRHFVLCFLTTLSTKRFGLIIGFLSVRWRIALRSSTRKERNMYPKVKLSAYRQEMSSKSFGPCWNASDQSEKLMIMLAFQERTANFRC